MNKPYLTGKVNDVLFVVDEYYQVKCNDTESKKLLQKLVRKGLATFEERKSWSKLLSQFYVEKEFKKNPSIKVKRVFVYENGAIIENIYLEDKADDSPLIWLQAAYLDVPFTIDTDLNVVIEDSATPNFDKIVECLIQMEFERIRYSSDGGEVPHIYSAMCDWIMEKEPDIKIKKAFLYIYPQEPDPPGGMIFY